MAGAAMGVALFLASAHASAQISPVAAPLAGSDAARSSGHEPDSTEIPTSPRSVKLFDGKNSQGSYTLDIGPIWTRKVEENTPAQNRENFDRGTGELSLGMVTTSPVGAVFIAGAQRTILRVLDSKKFSWSILHEDLVGGLRLGPLEPEVRFGASLASIDVFNAEWSVQLLSPRVSAGVGIRLGKFRIDLKGHAEYLWRWFGPDYFVRGVTLGVHMAVPRKTIFRDDPGPQQ